MITKNRPVFLNQAIWYFLRQDYPYRELIILDESSQPTQGLLQEERIRYIHLNQPYPQAEKLRIAQRMASGEIIAIWDDDDWQAPQRLRVQVSHLLNTGADVCAIRGVLRYSLVNGQAWEPVSPLYTIHQGTLVFHKSVTPEQVMIDSYSWVDDPNLYVAVLHGHNIRSPDPSPPHWQNLPLQEITTLLSRYGDLDFYVQLRNGGKNGNNRIVQPDQESLTLAAPFLVFDGYGSMAEYLALGLAKEGVRVNLDPISLVREGLSTALQQLLAISRPIPSAPVVFFHYPCQVLEKFRANPNIFINTMWESSQLPTGWASWINLARVAIAPTRFVARIFRECGVTVPIAVIPEGVAPEVYPYVNRLQREGMTTLMIGTLVDRKHSMEAIAAWKHAFEGDRQARLIIKARFAYKNYTPDDPRIKFVDSNEATRGILHWYEEADVLLALGSEGFGLPVVEGMATGLPVVALNSEGQSDTCQDAADYLLPVQPSHFSPYRDANYGECGVYGIPDVEQAADQLLWVRQHRDEAREMGKKASEWVHTNRNIWKKAPALLDVIERQSSPTPLLRRLPTLWVPSLGEECGIAEYTSHLAQQLNSVRVIKRYSESGQMRLLHIQHEDSLFGQGEELNAILAARQKGVRTIVTVHTVRRYIPAWQREADGLVALNSLGVQVLQSRWPGKPVAHIPVGCPTWFPPRKKARECVIGVFGFLGTHKGFWHLLEVLRKVPDTRLLMFSYSKSQDLLAMWKRDSAGLPVEHIDEYLPEEEIARRLAAQADLIAYWYDDFAPDYSSSASVVVGLASGVPVLTSRTSWFHDLQGVTYQPLDLLSGVQHLLEDTDLRWRVTQAAYDYCQTHTWKHITAQHQQFWNTISD
jgi:glycosyltransferase involved in cell wall biosynthesis